MKPLKKILFLALVFGITAIGAMFFYVLQNREPAPEVSFINLQGEKITSNQLRGKVLIVNFWATTCATCVAEMPDMVATYNKYHDKGLEFVAVAMRDDPPNHVVNFSETRRLPFHVALDIEGKLAGAFGQVRLTPTTFVIDKQGKIIKRFVGQPSFSDLHLLLEKELAS